MKKNLKITEVKDNLGAAVKKMGKLLNRLGQSLKSVVRKVDWHKFSLPMIILFILIAIVEITLGIMIYGFKIDNKVTQAAAKIMPFPIAVVNYDFVTYREYLNERDYIHHFYQATKQDEVSFKDIDGEIVNQLIENKLVSYEALRNNVHVEKQEMDSTIDSIVEQNGGKDKVEKVLQELYGLNLKKFSRLVKVQLLRDKIDDEMITKIVASHILVRVDQDAPAEQIDAGKVKIDGILKEIQEGLDFGEAAKKYSEDIGSAEQSGKLDPFAKGDMVESFSDAAFATKVGEISAPVRSEFGWHLIKVESKTGKIDKKFSDWLEEIRSKSLVLRFYEV